MKLEGVVFVILACQLQITPHTEKQKHLSCATNCRNWGPNFGEQTCPSAIGQRSHLESAIEDLCVKGGDSRGCGDVHGRASRLVRNDLGCLRCPSYDAQMVLNCSAADSSSRYGSQGLANGLQCSDPTCFTSPVCTRKTPTENSGMISLSRNL